MDTKVDIIINCFNGEKYLSEALKSVQKQDFPHWRIIFIDNCSTDDSAKIAKSFKGNLKYFKTEKKVSLGAARKIAVDMCNSEFISFIDCDDTWMPYKLSDQINTMKNKNIVLTYSGINNVDQNKKLISQFKPLKAEGNLLKKKLISFDINLVTALLRREFLIKNNLNFLPTMEASEEYNLFMRITALGQIHSSDKIHANYRLLENSLTNQFKEKWSEERNYTLNQIFRKNDKLSSTHKNEIEVARRRSLYYEACFLMQSKQYSSARRNLKRIASKEKKYFFLLAISLIPFLWNFFHKRSVKEKLTTLFLDQR